MAEALNYQELLDTLMNVQNSPQEQKLNALNTVVTKLQVHEPDPQFAGKAMITKLTIDALHPEMPDIRVWLNDEIAYFKGKLQEKVAEQLPQPNEDVQMAQGGRKKRRGKKTKKSKKSRRYTRRR